MNHTGAAALIVLLVAATCTLSTGSTYRDAHSKRTAAYWPVFQHDRSHSGRSELDTSANPGKEMWKSSHVSSPVIGADGTIYVNANRLYAFEPNGKLKWTFKTGGLTSAAIAADGTIYAGGRDLVPGSAYGESVCLFAIKANGRLKWKLEIEPNSRISLSMPVVGADGTIYIGASSYYWAEKKTGSLEYPVSAATGFLYAVSPDGKRKWTFQADGYVESAPAIDDTGTIYYGSGDHHLYALDSTGKLKWKFGTGGQVHGAPAVGAKDVIYFGSDDHYLYAVNPDGKLRWKFETGDCVDSGPSIGADGAVYIGSWDGFLYALTVDGKLKWKFATGNDVFASPAIGGDGTVYVGSTSWDGKLYAVHPGGILRWAFPTDGPILEPPAIGTNADIYVSSSEANVYEPRYVHGSAAIFFAIGMGGHAPTSSASATASGLEQQNKAPMADTHDWLIYNSDASGLSFRYPPSVKAKDRSADELRQLQVYAPFQNRRLSIVDLFFDGRDLVSIEVFGNVTPDEVVSNRRWHHMGLATHIELDGHDALAKMFCTGVCRWTVHLFENGGECEIGVEAPVILGSAGVVPPLHDGAYFGFEERSLPLLSILRTIHCDPSKGKASISAASK